MLTSPFDLPAEARPKGTAATEVLLFSFASNAENVSNANNPSEYGAVKNMLAGLMQKSSDARYASISFLRTTKLSL